MKPAIGQEYPAPSRGQSILRLLGTLAALGLLVYLLSQQGWEEIGAALRQIARWRLGLSLVLIFASRLAVWGRWHVLLRSGGVPAHPGQSLRITFAGLFATNFLPTTVGGDMIRLAGAIRLRFDPAVSAASLVADRLVGLAGMAMAVPIGLPRFIQAGRESSTGMLHLRTMLYAAAAPIMPHWLRRIWELGINLGRRVLQAMALWLKQPRNLLLSLAFSWIHMLCTFGVLTLLFNGMGADIGFWLVGGLYSVVYLITLLPFSINGYGLQEVSMTYVFSTVGGASLSSALTAALLFRTLMMVASLPGAAFVAGMLPGGQPVELKP